jgi:hypothetical protein
VGNKNRKLRGHTSRYLACCEVPYEEDGPKAPTTIHGLLGLKYHPLQKANATADCLENQFTPPDLCDENYERRVEARVKALLESADNSPLERVRPCGVQKLIMILKLRNSCGIDGIPKECFMHLPRRPLVHLTHLFNHCCIRLPHFPESWKGGKVTTLPKPGDPKLPQNLRSISLLSTTGKLFETVALKIVQRHIDEKYLLFLQVSFLSCTSQNDTSMYEAYGPCDPQCQQYVYDCGILAYLKKTFDLYKFSTLHFSISLIKLISSIL